METGRMPGTLRIERIASLAERTGPGGPHPEWRTACGPVRRRGGDNFTDAVEARINDVARARCWTAPHERSGLEWLYLLEDEGYPDARRAALAAIASSLRERHVARLVTDVPYESSDVLDDLVNAGFHIESQIRFGGVAEVHLGLAAASA